MLEFVDRLFWRMHRDYRSGRQPILVVAEKVRRVRVERAARHRSPFRVHDERNAQPHRRIQHHEVEAEIVEPLI
jgi:hypothetical protein